jgi:6-phosphofructokinase 1
MTVPKAKYRMASVRISRMKRLAVLASGGDAPGMNASVRAITRTAIARGVEVWGAWDGYNGLVDQRLQRLTSNSVAGLLARGGSIIGAGRSPRFFDPVCQQSCVDYLRDEGIGGVVVIGGEGSLAGAICLHSLGFPTVTVPGTIDNDMPGTETTIGADTAINTAVEAIDRLRDTASALKRAMIVEVMGRHCGYIAVMAGIATGAELILTPERPMELEEVFSEMKDTVGHGKRHFIVVSAEGARWRAAELADLINEAPNPFEARYTVLGYIQRGGAPSLFDRILATRMGVAAVEALLDGRSNVLTVWRSNRIEVLPADQLEPRRDPWNEALDRVHSLTRL